MTHKLQQGQAAALEAISSLLQRPFHLTAILDAVAETTCRWLDCAASSVMLIARGTRELTIEGSHGLAASYVEYVNHQRRVRIDAGELSMGPSGQAFKTRQPVVSTNAAHDPRLLPWRETPYAAMVALPLEFQGQVIGILNAYATAPREFTAEELSLLGLLASQAAVAIGVSQLLEQQQGTIEELQVLNERLTSQHSRLARAGEIHDRLTAVVLEGGGTPAVVAALADLLQSPVVLYDERLTPLTEEPEPLPGRVSLENLRGVQRPMRLPAEAAAGARHPSALVAVRRGEELLGFVRLIEAGRAVEEVDLTALEHGAQVLAIEFMHQRRLAEAEARMKRDLVLELVERRFEDSRGLVQRAERLGLALHGPYRALVLEPDEDDGGGPRLAAAVQAVVELAGPSALATRDGRRVVILWPEEARFDAAAAVARVQRLTGAGMAFSAGIGRSCAELGELHVSYGEALKALQLVRAMGGGRQVVDFERLGLHRVVLEASQPERLLEFARDLLGPAREHDRHYRTDLVHTLRAYLDSERSLKRTAEALFVHPNTVAYRLRKTQELCGIDLQRSRDAMAAELALIVLDLAGEGAERRR